jgi:hypothetical protein
MITWAARPLDRAASARPETTREPTIASFANRLAATLSEGIAVEHRSVTEVDEGIDRSGPLDAVLRREAENQGAHRGRTNGPRGGAQRVEQEFGSISVLGQRPVESGVCMSGEQVGVVVAASGATWR